jgi:hypothetical protein
MGYFGTQTGYRSARSVGRFIRDIRSLSAGLAICEIHNAGALSFTSMPQGRPRVGITNHFGSQLSRDRLNYLQITIR